MSHARRDTGSRRDERHEPHSGADKSGTPAAAGKLRRRAQSDPQIGEIRADSFEQEVAEGAER
jgi:hypothetical protein